LQSSRHLIFISIIIKHVIKNDNQCTDNRYAIHQYFGTVSAGVLDL